MMSYTLFTEATYYNLQDAINDIQENLRLNNLPLETAKIAVATESNGMVRIVVFISYTSTAPLTDNQVMSLKSIRKTSPEGAGDYMPLYYDIRDELNRLSPQEQVHAKLYFSIPAGKPAEMVLWY